MSPRIRSILLALLALLSLPKAGAMILYGTGPDDVSNTQNTTASGTGAPWDYVVQFGINNASGVYLGNGFILTAAHVDPIEPTYSISGVTYSRDTSFEPLQVTEAPASVDMMLIKILPAGMPPVFPSLPLLPINYSPADLSKTSTMIGWGKGKGNVVTGKGWAWGDEDTRAKRWGTATTSYLSFPISNGGSTYEALRTTFATTSADRAQITLGDSGCALFQKFGSTWKLSGLGATVSTGYFAYYNPPDYSYFVRLRNYAHLLRYENWANAKLGGPAASPTADPNQDGLNHLFDYAFHNEPSVASTTALPQVGMESGFLTLTYTRLLSATDLRYEVQESSDLTNPTGWANATVTEEIVSASGMTRLVKAKVAIGSATQKFLRLKVTRLE